MNFAQARRNRRRVKTAIHSGAFVHPPGRDVRGDRHRAGRRDVRKAHLLLVITPLFLGSFVHFDPCRFLCRSSFEDVFGTLLGFV